MVKLFYHVCSRMPDDFGSICYNHHHHHEYHYQRTFFIALQLRWGQCASHQLSTTAKIINTILKEKEEGDKAQHPKQTDKIQNYQWCNVVNCIHSRFIHITLHAARPFKRLALQEGILYMKSEELKLPRLPARWSPPHGSWVLAALGYSLLSPPCDWPSDRRCFWHWHHSLSWSGTQTPQRSCRRAVLLYEKTNYGSVPRRQDLNRLRQSFPPQTWNSLIPT